MQQFKLSQDLDLSPDRSWELFFAVEFNQELNEALGMREVTVMEFSEDENERKVTRRFVSNREVPPAIHKMTGATQLEYITHETFNKKKKTMDWTFETPMFEDGVKGSGQIVADRMPAGRVRRTFRGLLEADLPIIGEQVERRLVEVLGESFEKGAVIMRRYAAQDAADRAAGRPLRELKPITK